LLSLLKGLYRIIKAYITFHMKRDPKWDAKAVMRQTPYDICAFITQKCGPVEAGYEGRKVDALVHLMLTQIDANLHLQFSTAISTRAALTLWYRSIGQMRALLSGGLIKRWHLVNHIHSKHLTQAYKPRNTAMGCQLGHGWYLNS